MFRAVDVGMDESCWNALKIPSGDVGDLHQLAPGVSRMVLKPSVSFDDARRSLVSDSYSMLHDLSLGRGIQILNVIDHEGDAREELGLENSLVKRLAVTRELQSPIERVADFIKVGVQLEQPVWVIGLERGGNLKSKAGSEGQNAMENFLTSTKAMLSTAKVIKFIMSC